MLLPKLATLLGVFTILLKSMYAQSENCCSLTRTGLQSIEVHSSCKLRDSSSPFVTELGEKCDECPKGTCRLNRFCYCPSKFLDSSAAHSLCKSSFGEVWPSSVGKEDTIWRSCSLEEEQELTVDDVCCSLTREQLETRVGTSNRCPSITSRSDRGVKSLSGKCDRCPFGTCRINKECFCPKNFLRNDETQNLCRSSFTQRWNASVGMEDRHTRSCTRPSPPVPTTFDNCCMLSAEQLEMRVGTNEFCPKENDLLSSSLLAQECDACAFGTCRVGGRCYCPQNFLNSFVLKRFCRESFGVAHPDSVGRVDSRCNPTHQSLSAGAKAGIAIGSILGVIVLVVSLVLLWRMCCWRKPVKTEPTKRDVEGEDNGISVD